MYLIKMAYKIKTKKLKEKKTFAVKRMRSDVEVNKTQYGYQVTSDYGNYEEGFFNTKREAVKFAKTL